MAAPTPVTYTKQVGRYGLTLFQATWSTTDQYADQVVVDLSALTTYTTTLAVLTAHVSCTATMQATLEFKATSDQLVWCCPVGATVTEKDWTKSPLRLLEGLDKTETGGTGDLVVTTTGAASGSQLFIAVEWIAT